MDSLGDGGRICGGGGVCRRGCLGWEQPLQSHCPGLGSSPDVEKEAAGDCPVIKTDGSAVTPPSHLQVSEWPWYRVSDQRRQKGERIGSWFQIVSREFGLSLLGHGTGQVWGLDSEFRTPKSWP